jgi:alpha/beta superfamily hydrolase
MSEKSIEIQGPAGIIEANYRTCEDATRAALVCHPHPLYGGSMYDAVVACMCRAAAQLNIASLSFNFRGVGKSQGQHDQGIGEVEDVVFLSRWLKDQQGIEAIYLGGYSFGAMIALNAASELDVPLEHLMLIAPPIQVDSGSLEVSCPTTIIAGKQDNIVDVGAVQNWLSTANSPAELIELEAADHFFMGFHQEIESALVERLA